MRIGNPLAVMLGLTLLGSACGCRVRSDKDGNHENVDIATPFGGLSVKTNNAGTEGPGLPVYPGAEMVHDHKDKGSADVNMNFGGFHLRVKAADYRTGDAPTQVTAFYKKALGRYGDVIQCEDHHPIGQPAQTSEGLTCEQDGNHDGNNGPSNTSGKIELKAGSKQHQHIASIEPESSGTRFGLLALDLPGQITFGDAPSRDGGKSQ